MLMDVCPTKDGRIIPFFQERLRQLGSWLGVNGEAIYSTIPWSHQHDTLTGKIWYVLIVLQLHTIIIGSLQSFSIFNKFQYVFFYWFKQVHIKKKYRWIVSTLCDTVVMTGGTCT
jgi:hypothetical protein